MTTSIKAIIAVYVLLIMPAASSASEMSELETAVKTPALSTLDAHDIGLWARFHFALHTSDFKKTREFYRTLGFTKGLGGFPLNNNHAVARALGMNDICGYELAEGEVLLFPGAINTTGIDLLQFIEPHNPAPPYDSLNHLGMAYATLLTRDLTDTYNMLRASGVEFLTEPFGVHGNRFVFMRDPEGVFLKLEEQALPQPIDNGTTGIVGMPYVGINVSDLEASLKFYALFGYTEVRPINEQELGHEEAKAWGFDRPVRYRGADIAIRRGDKHRLRLLQWIDPFNKEAAYPPPINHKGINRLALTVPDVERAVAILKKQGVPFLSEVAPCCSASPDDDTGIVHAIDPDGVFLELVGHIEPRPLAPQPPECPELKLRYQ